MVVILGFTFIIYKEELDKNGKQKVDFNKTSKKNRWNFLWLFMISEALLVLWLGMKRVINLKLIPQDYIKIFKFIYNIVFFLFSIYLFLLWCSFTLIFYNDFWTSPISEEMDRFLLNFIFSRKPQKKENKKRDKT